MYKCFPLQKSMKTRSICVLTTVSMYSDSAKVYLFLLLLVAFREWSLSICHGGAEPF